MFLEMHGVQSDTCNQMFEKVAEDLASEQPGVIILQAPPRWGKSTFAIMALARMLDNNPDMCVLVATYGTKLTQFWMDELRSLTKNGWVQPCAVGDNLTGRSYDFVWADDLFKNQMTASNPIIRQRTWGWMNGIVVPRMREEARCLITQTRHHPSIYDGSPDRRRRHYPYSVRDGVPPHCISSANAKEFLGDDAWDVMYGP